MKGDQMGIRAAYPTPRELPLSNQTRFRTYDFSSDLLRRRPFWIALTALKPARRGCVQTGGGAREIQQRTPHVRARDAVEGDRDRDRLAVGEQGRVQPVLLFYSGSGGSVVRLEKVRDGNIEDACDLVQAARADPVHALFVLLHLRDGDPKRLAELFLAHADQHAPHP